MPAPLTEIGLNVIVVVVSYYQVSVRILVCTLQAMGMLIGLPFHVTRKIFCVVRFGAPDMKRLITNTWCVPLQWITRRKMLGIRIATPDVSHGFTSEAIPSKRDLPTPTHATYAGGTPRFCWYFSLGDLFKPHQKNMNGEGG